MNCVFSPCYNLLRDVCYFNLTVEDGYFALVERLPNKSNRIQIPTDTKRSLHNRLIWGNRGDRLLVANEILSQLDFFNGKTVTYYQYLFQTNCSCYL